MRYIINGADLIALEIQNPDMDDVVIKAYCKEVTVLLQKKNVEVVPNGKKSITRRLKQS